jgi:multiple sugar transport system permease protein
VANAELVIGRPARARLGAFTRRRYLLGYSMLAPAIVYMVVLVGVPFLWSIYLSLSNATVGTPVAHFVGFQNFEAVLSDSVVRLAIRNTVLFTVIATVLQGLLGLLLAFLLMQEFPGRKLMRFLVVIPWTLPTAISALAWKWMFDPQFSAINYVARALHILSPDMWPNWLGEPGLAFASVVIVNVWRGFPFAAIVLLAGLTSVPPEIVDSAKVDGAGFWVRFHYVIVPIIAPILFVGLLFNMVFTLGDISIVFLLTQGGPMSLTEILPTKALEIGIQAGALDRGAAISLLLFPILVPIVWVFLRMLARTEAAA